MIEGVDTSGAEPSVDNGAERDTRPAKPCAKRMTRIAEGAVWYAFCVKPDGHTDHCGCVKLSRTPAPSSFDKGKYK